MTVPEARRHDLYNALEEVLGTDRADTLMAHLPTTEAAALATRGDFEEIRAEVKGIRAEIQVINQRLDRLFLTLAAGLLAVVGSLVVAIVVG